MRLGKVVVCLAFALFGVVTLVSAQPARGRAVAGQILVTFAPGANANARVATHRAANGQVLTEVPGRGVALVAVSQGDEQAAIARYRRNPNVVHAEPNYVRSIPEPTAHDGGAVVPRDTHFGQQWGFHNAGQEFYCIAWVFGDLCFFQGTPGADIDAPEAWAISTGSPAVTVAVIDTGIDYNHPDLATHYAGGYDFVHGTFDPLDDHGHGTHVAGTIAASIDNLTGSPAAAEGVVGVAPQARILAYKVCAGDGTCTDFAVIQAIARAVADGAQVINMSLGDTVYSQSLADAVQAAWNAGVVIVAGAGNDGVTTPFYPAALDNVIAVGAFDQDHRRASFSNYGNWVDISAPGNYILSTYPASKCEEAGTPGDTGCYAWLSGTSMATPHVAGAAALLWSRGDVTNKVQVVDLLLRTADPSGVSSVRLDTWTIHGGLNLHDAMSDGLATGRPVANAGTDQTVKDADGSGEELVSLDGSASHDPNGSVVAYEWREGTTILGGAAALTVPLAVGAHTLTLEVTDNDGLTATDTVLIIVEPAVIVTVTASSAEAREAGLQPGALTLTRDGNSAAPLAVQYVVSGSAITGSDYQALPGLVQFDAGAATATVVVTPIDDELLESNETVVVTLTAGAGYSVGAGGSATVAIVSDDLPPDLVVSAANGPPFGGADTDIVVTDTTKNQGTGAANPSASGFYLSTNTALDAADVFLGSRPVPRLVPGATSTASTTVRIPASTATGNYYVLVRGDWDAQVAESVETNNVRSAGQIKIGPDLTVSALTTPASGAPGGSLSVSDTTSNSGAGRAAATTTRFFLSTNTSLDASDVLLGSRDVPELAPGAALAGVTVVTLPASTMGGAYYVIAQADSAQTLSETSEVNNTKVAASLKVGADLVISGLVVPPMGALGGTISVTDSTKNQGAGPAGETSTALYLSTNSSFDATDVFLGARFVAALAPGVTSTVTTALQVPAGTAPGLYYVVARADWDNAAPEGVESNNTRGDNIRIGPDLAVTSFLVPSSAPAGSGITVSDTTKNQGPEAVPVTTTSFYLSTNSSFGTGDVLLGVRTVGVLAAGASDVRSTTLTIPQGTVPGAYYVIAVADGDGHVVEAVETNNTKSRVLSITVPSGS
jgi:subtilisin family serine protease/subtilase family serine protease